MTITGTEIAPGTILGSTKPVRSIAGRTYRLVMIADPLGKYTRSDFVRYTLVKMYEPGE
jgi:hypothetical protein